MNDIELIKNKLSFYKKEHIIFNEPHFTNQLIRRDGNRDDIISNILNPISLTDAEEEIGKYGDKKYILYFSVAENRTLILPVIFSKNGKHIYILTYIMRYRRWERK